MNLNPEQQEIDNEIMQVWKSNFPLPYDEKNITHQLFFKAMLESFGKGVSYLSRKTMSSGDQME